ncbi:MAG: VOC family protein [Austwickia sp.]|nr:VOC family protein [Austwickia sp.]MBK8436100.1 VOC family protein [Austwickia sp.]MBK9101781.1 VOC family protein [Austwickia sp.]
MAQQLNPYITFDGNCAEAMAFYAAVLGGTVQTMTFRDAGMDEDGVMHAALATPTGFHLYASDTAGEMSAPYTVGNNVQVSLSGDEAEALRGYWEALSDGADIIMPMERQMWGDEYGLLSDRFGILWHVNIAGASG